MPTIKVPPIHYPFPSLLHPRVNDIEHHTITWCSKFGLVTTAAGLKRLHKSKFGWLLARVFPQGSMEGVCLASDYNTWLFLRDDQTDHSDPDQLEASLHLTYACIDYLEANSFTTNDPMLAALRNIWERIEALGYPGGCARLRKSLGEYLASTLWEATNRQKQQIPGLKEYLHMRTYTGAMRTEPDLVEVVEKVQLPDEILQLHTLERLRLACCNLVTWSNDIVSFNREIAQGDVHNIILTLQQEYNITQEGAILEAMRMHDEEVALFVKLEQEVPVYGNAVDQHLERYVAGLRNWVRGNVDWAVKDTLRYSME